MAVYGRATGTSNAFGESTTSTSNVRASVYEAIPEHGWAYAWTAQVGVQASGNSASIRGHLWATISGNPGALLASTDPIATSRVMTGSADGQAVVGGNLTSIVRLAAGARFALGWAHTGPLRHGMTTAGALPASANKLFYYRSTAGTGPYNPNGYTSTSTEGQLTTSILYAPNQAPNIPTGLSPAGTTTNASPAFTGLFRDANETVNGRDNTANERLKQFRIQARTVGSTTLLWDGTYGAPADQQAARQFSSGWGGPGQPVAGTAYEWRAQVSDQCDAWSAWTDWTAFTVNGGGTLTVTGGGGKRTSQTPLVFPVTWTHLNGLSLTGYRAQILQGGTVVRESGTIQTGQAFTPGSSFTAFQFQSDWANMAPLDWGVAYTIRFAGRDTTGAWSEYGPALAFTTNARPTTPAALSPASGTVVAALPVLSFTLTDADDTPASGLVAYVRIKNNAGTVLFTRAAALGSDGRWSYQTTSTDLPSFTTYRWDAYGSDGLLTSGTSAEQTLVYAQGPVIAVTAPTANQVIATTSATVTWTVTNQASYQLRVYPAGGSTPVLTGPTVTNTATRSTSLSLASLANNTNYEVTVSVTNTSGLTAESARRAFRLQFPPAPTITGVTASPELAAGDVEPSVIRVTWNPTTLGADFGGYLVGRFLPGAIGDDTGVLFPLITSPSQTVLLDQSPISGQEYVYVVWQYQTFGTTRTVSVPATSGTVGITINGVIITDRADIGRRVVLDLVKDTEVTDVDDRRQLEPWSDGPPVLLIGGLAYQSIRASYALRDRPGVAARDQLAALRAMRGTRDDAARTPILTDYRSAAVPALTGAILGLSAKPQRGGWIAVQFEFREVRS